MDAMAILLYHGDAAAFEGFSESRQLFEEESCLIFGRRPERRRKMTPEGLVESRRARRVPKSVSAETMVRPSSAALSNMSSSAVACMPWPRTCSASCPAFRKGSATSGDRALSTRKRERAYRTSGISLSRTAMAA